MMGTKIRSFSPLPHDLSLEDLVPQDHFYRRLAADKTEAADEVSEPHAAADLDALPAASDRELRAKNERRGDWISKDGEPDRTIVRGGYRRRSDYELSPTDPDASLMQHKRGASRMGYHAHYVVDGGKARVILNVLVTPADVTEAERNAVGPADDGDGSLVLSE